jgi:hypothetical protein
MKTIICMVAGFFFLLVIGLPVARSQEGYTFFMSSGGPRICLGQWIPPRGAGYAGSCEGTVMDLPQLTALSSKQTVDRLDQLLVTLNSIDQKMTTSIDQTNQLIKETRDTKKSLDTQVQQTNQLLHQTISQRFDALPREILANPEFKEELLRLKEDVLKEVDKYYQPRPAPEAQ